MKALILSAGTGERLMPITATRPKSMIQIMGKPVLEYSIEGLKQNGIKDIVIVVGYQRDKIIDYFGYGSDFGVRIRYVIQNEPKGVADAILLAKDELNGEDEFLLLFGDVIVSSEMISRVIQTNKDLNATSTMLVTLVDNPQDYGIAKIGSKARIEEVIEKPSDGVSSNYALAGVFYLNSMFLKYLEESKFVDKAFNRMIADDYDIYASVWEKPWAEFTWPWDILKANDLVLRENLRNKGSWISEKAKISESATIEGSVIISDDVVIRPGASIIGPAYIGAHSYIGNSALIRKYTSICENVKIGYGVEIKGSVIFRNTWIGRLSYIGDSVIGANVRFEAGTQTWNWSPRGHKLTFMIDNIEKEIPLEKVGIMVGDNSVIGINVAFHPAIRIGYNVDILPGIVVTEDIPPNSIVSEKRQLEITKKEDI